MSSVAFETYDVIDVNLRFLFAPGCVARGRSPTVSMATTPAAVGVATTRTRTDVAVASSSVASVLASRATKTLGFTSKQNPVLFNLAVETETGFLAG